MVWLVCVVCIHPLAPQVSLDIRATTQGEVTRRRSALTRSTGINKHPEKANHNSRNNNQTSVKREIMARLTTVTFITKSNQCERLFNTFTIRSSYRNLNRGIISRKRQPQRIMERLTVMVTVIWILWGLVRVMGSVSFRIRVKCRRLPCNNNVTPFRENNQHRQIMKGTRLTWTITRHLRCNFCRRQRPSLRQSRQSQRRI